MTQRTGHEILAHLTSKAGSATALAGLLGVHPNTIANWRKSEEVPRLAILALKHLEKIMTYRVEPTATKTLIHTTPAVLGQAWGQDSEEWGMYGPELVEEDEHIRLSCDLDEPGNWFVERQDEAGNWYTALDDPLSDADVLALGVEFQALPFDAHKLIAEFFEGWADGASRPGGHALWATHTEDGSEILAQLRAGELGEQAHEITISVNGWLRDEGNPRRITAAQATSWLTEHRDELAARLDDWLAS